MKEIRNSVENINGEYIPPRKSDYEDYVNFHVKEVSSEEVNTTTSPNENNDETTLLLPNKVEGECKEWTLYSRRWYILTVYSVLSCQQSILWITFSPIATSTKEYFNTTDTVVNLLLAWGSIAFIPFLFFSGYLMNMKGGLRKVVLLGAILDAAGGGIRCLALIHPKHWTAVYLLSIGQILNAFVGPLVMASPSKLSATWFGEKERTTVTAIATFANVFGAAIGFLYSPYVVKYTSVPMLLIVQAAEGVVIMIWVLIYFPEKPPTPPSASASVNVDNAVNTTKKRGFYSEIWTLLHSPSFNVLSIIGGYGMGALGAWLGMFDIILGPHGYSQTLVGWLGFAANMSGIVGGIAIGMLGDTLFKRKFKGMLIVMFALSCLLFVYFSLSFPSVVSKKPLVPNKEWIIIASITLGGLFLGSTNPIFFELGAEITFPISEGSSAALITIWNNIANLILLLAGPKIPADWINFGVAASIGVCSLLLFFVREKYLRTDFDAVHHSRNTTISTDEIQTDIQTPSENI